MKLPTVVKTGVVFVAATCLVLVLTGTAAAQNVGGGFKAGVALGDIPNTEKVFQIPEVETSQRIGFAAGGFVMMRWRNGFGIQPEALYTQKGVKIGATGDTGQAWVKLDFLDVPVLARYTFGRGVRGYVFGGPSFDLKVSAKIKESVQGHSDEEDISDEAKSFEFAVVFGGGIELGPILLEARWCEGLTNLDTAATDTTDVPVKTRTFLFLGGIRF